jgi:hypothetical protein
MTHGCRRNSCARTKYFCHVAANLLSIDVSFLIPGMVRISDSLQEQLKE